MKSMTPCPECGREPQPGGHAIQAFRGPDEISVWHHTCAEGHAFHVSRQQDRCTPTSVEYGPVKPCNCDAPSPLQRLPKSD